MSQLTLADVERMTPDVKVLIDWTVERFGLRGAKSFRPERFGSLDGRCVSRKATRLAK